MKGVQIRQWLRFDRENDNMNVNIAVRRFVLSYILKIAVISYRGVPT